MWPYFVVALCFCISGSDPLLSNPICCYRVKTDLGKMVQDGLVAAYIDDLQPGLEWVQTVPLARLPDKGDYIRNADPNHKAYNHRGQLAVPCTYYSDVHRYSALGLSFIL